MQVKKKAKKRVHEGRRAKQGREIRRQERGNLAVGEREIEGGRGEG